MSGELNREEGGNKTRFFVRVLNFLNAFIFFRPGNLPVCTLQNLLFLLVRVYRNTLFINTTSHVKAKCVLHFDEWQTKKKCRFFFPFLFLSFFFF